MLFDQMHDATPIHCLFNQMSNVKYDSKEVKFYQFQIKLN